MSGLQLLAGGRSGGLRSRHVRPLHHPGAPQLGSQTPGQVRVQSEQNILCHRSHRLLRTTSPRDGLLLLQVRKTPYHRDTQDYYCRVYLETRRLQRRPLVTKCSLKLFVEHFPVREDMTGEDEDTGDPDVIFVASSGIQPIQEMSEKKTETSAANKLFLVIAGFLICWLPYFLWLPFSTLLVSISLKSSYLKGLKVSEENYSIFHTISIQP